MATNKKKILLTQSMSPSGRALLKERGDIVIVDFLNTISSPDFQALLAKEAPVNAVALGATRFGPKELEAPARCWWWPASASASTPSTCRR